MSRINTSSRCGLVTSHARPGGDARYNGETGGESWRLGAGGWRYRHGEECDLCVPVFWILQLSAAGWGWDGDGDTAATITI